MRPVHCAHRFPKQVWPEPIRILCDGVWTNPAEETCRLVQKSGDGRLYSHDKELVTCATCKEKLA